MVNEKLSTKAYILQRLRQERGAFVSGTRLGEALGISRVAVWKAVKSLLGAGYPIEEASKGYRLAQTDSEDFLYPWEFGEKESLFHYWKTTDSTMNRAGELAAQGICGGTVITAETQTAGRGRNGKPWVSAQGGLFFTLLERPGLAVADYALMTITAHIAAAGAIGRLCGKRALLRWPNDIYIEGRKIAGILSELHGEGDRLSWIALGIGINVGNDPASPNSANCTELLGRPVSRREALLAVLQELEKTKRLKDYPQELCGQWNQIAEGRGGRIAVVDPSRKTIANYKEAVGKGIFLGIDTAGRGMVKTDTGITRFTPGSASFVFL